MTPLQALAWQQLNVSIAFKREELQLLEEKAALIRETAAATARNILRAYDVSIDEVIASLADDAKASVYPGLDGRKPRRVAAEKPAAPEQEDAGRAPGPLSRLPTLVKNVLANQGLRTFDAIAQAIDSGEILRLPRMGPTRQAQLSDWLRQERQQ